MSLDAEFLQGARELHAPAMGTEVMATLLYSLARFIRPRSVLEVGSGYTTPFLLRALADNAGADAHERSWIRDRGGLIDRARLLNHAHYDQPYRPRLVSIDTLDHPHSTASRVEAVARRLSLDEYLEFHHADFRGHSEQLDPGFLPIDLAWTDAGSWELFLAFFNEYWELINPAGGLWVIHSTQTNLQGIAFVDRLKLLQATEAFRDLELISLIEPHKVTQNSTTIVRRTSACVDRIFTTQP